MQGLTHRLESVGSDERFYELYFAFAQQSRVNAKALPGLLDFATVWPVTSEHAVLATPPPVIQHALFRLLGPVARITTATHRSTGKRPCRSTRHAETPVGRPRR